MIQANQSHTSIVEYVSLFKLDVKRVYAANDSNSSQVFIIQLTNDEKVILKIPHNTTKFQRETKTLNILKNKIPIPEVIATFNGNENIKSAILMTYIQHSPLQYEMSKNIPFDIGVILAQLHNVSLSKYNSLEMTGAIDSRAHWLETQKSTIQESAYYCSSVLSKEIVDLCQYRLELYSSKLKLPDVPCLTHNDFRLGNILCSGGKIVGLIDFEVAGGGVPESDFVLIKNEIWDKSSEGKKYILEGYKTIRCIENIENNLPYFELLTCLNRVAWCIKRKKTTETYYYDFLNKLMEIIQ